MTNVQDQDKIQLLAMQNVIKQLRSDDLSQGHCFMIFDDDLPEDEAYYEYPDGSFRIEQVNKTNLNAPRRLVKVLSKTKIATLKTRNPMLTFI